MQYLMHDVRLQKRNSIENDKNKHDWIGEID